MANIAVWRAGEAGPTEEDTMTKLDQVDLKGLARIGAATRLAELEREIATLRRVFPGLKVLSVDVIEARDPHAAAAAGVAEKVARKRAKKKVRRGRRTPMTEAEKQAVSARMKKYWAGRRAEKKGKGKKAAKAEKKAEG
jgi:hypothetical protein